MNQHKISKAADQVATPGEPEHPGGWIRRNLLEPFGLGVAEAARRMSINRPTFSNVLDGKHAVSRELSYKLEALTGVDADLLIGMQAAYDTAQDREKRERYAREIERLPEPA
jgi:addiction module HigA family antidote